MRFCDELGITLKSLASFGGHVCSSALTVVLMILPSACLTALLDGVCSGVVFVIEFLIAYVVLFCHCYSRKITGHSSS